MTMSLFGEDESAAVPPMELLGPGAVLLRRFALAHASEIQAALRTIERAAPFRHMHTPGGHRMSVAMTNCGKLGWVTDRRGYRYDSLDPESGAPWPSMPDVFMELARRAAASADFADFAPDACLINRYQPGARMTLHQDKNERDFTQPIVSVSLGLPALFLFGGMRREDKPMRVLLEHGDVVVWGGAARLRFHGVLPLKDSEHYWAGAARINLTFRRAG